MCNQERSRLSGATNGRHLAMLNLAINLTRLEHLRQGLQCTKGIYVLFHIRRLAWTQYNPKYHPYCDKLV